MVYSSFDGYIYWKKLMIYYNRSYLQQHSMLVSLSYKIRFVIFIEFGIPFYYNGYKYVHNITVTHSVILLTNVWKLLGLNNKKLILLLHSKNFVVLKGIIIGSIKVTFKKLQICLLYKWCFCEKIYRNQKAIIRKRKGQCNLPIYLHNVPSYQIYHFMISLYTAAPYACINNNINSFVTDNKVMAGFAIRNNVFIKSIVNVGTGRHKYQ